MILTSDLDIRKFSQWGAPTVLTVERRCGRCWVDRASSRNPGPCGPHAHQASMRSHSRRRSRIGCFSPPDHRGFLKQRALCLTRYKCTCCFADVLKMNPASVFHAKQNTGAQHNRVTRVVEQPPPPPGAPMPQLMRPFARSTVPRRPPSGRALRVPRQRPDRCGIPQRSRHKRAPSAKSLPARPKVSKEPERVLALGLRDQAPLRVGEFCKLSCHILKPAYPLGPVVQVLKRKLHGAIFLLFFHRTDRP